MEVAVADSCISKVAGYQVMTLTLRDEEDLIIIPCLFAAQVDTLVMGQLDICKTRPTSWHGETSCRQSNTKKLNDILFIDRPS
jgi:hypothetical protein